LAQESAAIAKTQAMANDLVRSLRGGDLDITGFDIDLGQRLTNTIDDLSKAENKAYGAIRQTVGPSRPIDFTKAQGYINSRLADLGGDATGLSKPERALYKLVKNTQKAEDAIPVTYERLDTLRKDIGEGYKRVGRFKDEASADLDKVYGLLSDIQKDAIGAVDDALLNAYEGANKMTQQRKGLQGAMTRLFGKDAESGALAPKIQSASTALVKGDIKKYNQLLKDVPKDLHPDLNALILDKVLGFGSRTADGLGEGFAKGFKLLNKNKAAKSRLYSQLPKGVGKKIDDIGRVWSGLIESKALENNSKTARDLFAAMDNEGALRKLFNFTVEEGAPPGTRGIASKIVRAKGKSSVEKAEKLITSPEFVRSVKARAMNKGNAESVLSNSKVYKEWFDLLDSATQKAISDSGFFNWFTSGAAISAPAVEESIN
jgi:hypothetical protein